MNEEWSASEGLHRLKYIHTRTSLVSPATHSFHCLTVLSPQEKNVFPSGATDRPRTKPECAYARQMHLRTFMSHTRTSPSHAPVRNWTKLRLLSAEQYTPSVWPSKAPMRRGRWGGNVSVNHMVFDRYEVPVGLHGGRVREAVSSSINGGVMGHCRSL